MHTLPRFIPPSGTSVFALGAWLVILISLTLPANASTLTLTPSSIWAGNVAVGKTATISCTLKNSGPSNVSISKATSNNSAYTVSSPAFPLTLGSGKSTTVSIKFTPKSYQRAIGTITFTSNASNPTVSLALNGWGVGGKIAASYGSMNLGSAVVGKTVTMSQTLTNVGSSSVTISSANTNGSAFGRTGISTPLTLSAGQKVTFTVFFRPVTAGTAIGSLTVLSNGVNPTVSIPLTGTGLSSSSGTLSVSPTTVSFGNVTVGSSKTATATLAASGANIVVSSATTTNSEFTLSGATFPVTIGSGKSLSLTVKFAPKSSGTASGKISLVSSASNSPAVQSLSGSGVSASQHKVNLSWKSSTTPIAGYNIYRGTKAGGPYSKLNSSPNSSISYMDSSVSAGLTYYFVVTGVDSMGMESKYSSEVKAVVPSP